MPNFAQNKERELLAACGKNGYERALVLMQMVAFQGEDAARKAQLLQVRVRVVPVAGRLG